MRWNPFHNVVAMGVGALFLWASLALAGEPGEGVASATVSAAEGGSPASGKTVLLDPVAPATEAMTDLLADKQGQTEVFGYSLIRLGAAVAVILLVLIINTIVRHICKQREKEEDEKESGQRKSFFGTLIHSAERPLRLVMWAMGIRFLGLILKAPESKTVWTTQLVFSIAIALFIYRLVDLVEYYFKRYAESTENQIDDVLVPVVRKTLRVLVVVVAGLHIYSSAMNADISSILAGLGIGGLAFALAAQDTLRNLFGFAMILADRPFLVGERINFDGHDGIIEAMGFRSVKLRRLDGHQVVIPNSAAADHVIHNIARRPYIRRVFNITITYDTPVDKIERAVEIVRAILDNHEGMDPEYPPRCYFDALNADSLNLITIYWYHPPSYWDYLDHAQRVNVELMRRFEAEGIEFAFPTQTLYLAGDPKRELVLKHLNENAEQQGLSLPGGDPTSSAG